MIANPLHTEEFLRFLFAPGELFEIRALECRGGDKVLVGVYNDPHVAAIDAAEMCDKYHGKVFYSINPVDPESLYVSNRRINNYQDSLRSLNKDSVLRRKHVLVDIDPERPAGICATDQEKACTIVAANLLVTSLRDLGLPHPLPIDSGSGTHLLHLVEGDLEDAAVSGYLRCLKAMTQDLTGISIDLKVVDLPRIARLPGTINRKGPNTAERPHRLAKVVNYPVPFAPVPAGKIIGLARDSGYVPPEERPTMVRLAGDDELTQADVLHLIEKDYPGEFKLNRIVNKGTAVWFYLRACPMTGRPHTGAGGTTNCSALKLDAGELSFHCFGCERVSFYWLIKDLIKRTGKRPTNPLMVKKPPEPDVDQYHHLWSIETAPTAVPPPPPAPTLTPSPLLSPALRSAGRPTPALGRAQVMTALPRLWLDFETESEKDITVCGRDNYLRHPSTRATLLSYRYDDGSVVRVDLKRNPILPSQLVHDLLSPAYQKVAWNVGFEMDVLWILFGLQVCIDQWFDSMVLARYLGYPGDLESACKAIGLSGDERKKEGSNELKALFCKPQANSKKAIKAGAPAEYWATRESHPNEWQKFMDYNEQDVVSLCAVTEKMEQIAKLPQREYELWKYDFVINSRGVPVDLRFVNNAMELMAIADTATVEELKHLTGITNPNSPQQIKAWCKAKGFTMKSVSKDNVSDALRKPKLPSEVRTMLLLKQRLSGSAARKLPKIIECVSSDRMLRDQFQFYGADATGRWSSHGVQLHNLARPHPELKKKLEAITEAIRAGHSLPAGMDVANAVKSTIRSFLRAPDGYKLPLFDFSTIENRVLAFISECPAMMNTFRLGLDAYKMFAAAVLNRPYDSITKEERDAFKAAVLGLGYGLSAQRLADDSLNKYNVELSLADAEKQIRVFKRINPEIELFWNALESGAKKAIAQRCRVTVKCFVFNGGDPTRLEILLPSGRSLYLRSPKLVKEDGRDNSCIEYGTEKIRQRIWGSKLCAYVTQSTARDLLAEALLACRDANLPVIMSCHDEIVLLTPDAEAEAAFQKLDQIMHTVPAWLDGLPIMAEGAIQTFYHKP